MSDDFIQACLAVKEAEQPGFAYGMVVNETRWDQVVSHADLVKPAPAGLMEFCGFKVAVNNLLPDYIIVWTDAKGAVVHVSDLRPKDEQAPEA